MPTFEPGTVPLTGLASIFNVVRYHRDLSGDQRFEALPNIRCESIHSGMDLQPPSAQFSYILDDTNLNSPFPFLMEELWPLGPDYPYVVQQDDELLVFETDDTGTTTLVFDGFALIPQLNMSGGLQVTFAAVDVDVRLADTPIENALYRDAYAPTVAGSEVKTDLPVWFNPYLNPNATPAANDINVGTATAYPAFLDSTANGATVTPDYWTLGSYIRYLCQTVNSAQTYVNNPVAPTGTTIDDYLQAVTPVDGQFMDLTNPATYTATPITIRSFDATGKTFLEAACEQLNYYGFHLGRTLFQDPSTGDPINGLLLFRVDGLDGVAPVSLFYPLEGASIANGLPDFQSLALARDALSEANEFAIETAPDQFEISVTLAPGFLIASGDASTPANFNTSAIAGGTDSLRKKYRYFVFDEAGLGHWDFGSSSWKTGTPTSLDVVLGAPAQSVRTYVAKLRPGEHTLFSLDDAGTAYKAELAISRNYAGEVPGLWDKSGDWRSLGNSGWKLDKDALAIWITCDNPEGWKVPKGNDATAPGDVVRAVTSLASPSSVNTKFTLRLTTVISGDKGIDAVATKRQACPTPFTIRRVIDSKDHWRKQTVSTCSMHNSTDADEVIRDDTDKAKAHAEALRDKHEFPAIAGPIVIPWITHAFGIGDLVDMIDGRGISLAQNAGAPAGEAPRLPAVVGVDWTCQNPQTTTLHLSDQRTEPERATHGFTRSR